MTGYCGLLSVDVCGFTVKGLSYLLSFQISSGGDGTLIAFLSSSAVYTVYFMFNFFSLVFIYLLVLYLNFYTTTLGICADLSSVTL